MPIGLKRGTVKIVPYDPHWITDFESEKRTLIDTFGNKVIAIEHIGSTAIPGISAKPIIDINMAVESIDDISEFIEPLQKLGYQYMVNRRFADRYFFPKGPESFRTHHLNIVVLHSETAWANPLLFREYLKSNPIDKERYEQLKQRLAKQFAFDRDAYTEAKSSFIADIVMKAKRQALELHRSS